MINENKVREKNIRSNSKKSQQLGMPIGTATGRLRKMIIFDLLKRCGENICYRCKREINNIDELSIEHKESWLDKDVTLFWDLNNIAFSHLSCNCRDGGKPLRGTWEHGRPAYLRGQCRCSICTKANTDFTNNWRWKTGKRIKQKCCS